MTGQLERLPDGQRPLVGVFREMAGDPVAPVPRDPEVTVDKVPPVNGRVFLGLLLIAAIAVAVMALVGLRAVSIEYERRQAVERYALKEA